jgi:uridine kinase
MNIVEAYIKFKGQLIILISGLSGSGKSELAENIRRDFKLQIINLETFCDSEFNKTVTLSNNKKIINWDDIESYNWKNFNNKINELKHKGIIAIGSHFIETKLEFEPDWHLHVKISKDNLITKRKKYINEHRNINKCKDLALIIDSDPNTFYLMNQITFDYYYIYVAKSKIDIYLNANENTNDQIYDKAADFLIKKIQHFVNKYDENGNIISNNYINRNNPKNINRNKNTYRKNYIGGNIISDKKTDSLSDSESSNSDNISPEPIFLGTENKIELSY